MVLSRNINEAIIIDGHIKITVLEMRRGEVRLGIEAPPEIPVHRQEIQERIDAVRHARETMP